MRVVVLLLSLSTVACSVPSPKENLDSLSKVEANQISTQEKVDVQKAAPLKFNSTTRTQLKTDDPVVFLDAKKTARSYYKVFQLKPQGEQTIIDVHTYPSKGLGFGQLGQILPLVIVYSEKGKVPDSQVETLFSGYDRSFADGQFMRSVVKLKGPNPNKNYFIAVAADSVQTGRPMPSMTNYGGAAYGIITTEPVQVSPVGAFSILQTDKFEPPKSAKK